MSRDARSWHFGMLSFTGTGHLNPLITLAQQLTGRGHRVTFFERSKIRDRILQAGIEFVPVCDDRSAAKPPGGRPGILSEIATLRFNLKRISSDLEEYLRQTPTAIREAGIDALLVNEIALTGPTVAQQLGLPYFIISTSVPHQFGWRAFPWFSGYRYASSIFSCLETALFEVSALRMRGPIRHVIDRYRKRAGLGPVRSLSKTYPPLAQITQLPLCLDDAGKRPPGNFHYSGPFVSTDARSSVAFPWEQLDGRPIVYASLGTTRNAQPMILRLIAEACQDLDVQLVLSLGDRFAPEDFADLPGRPLVTRFAPQLEILRRAALVITHAGFNTAFEALMEGKPMVAIPLAHDQPAIAARVARSGAAQVLPVMRLSAPRIRAAVFNVLHNPAFRDAAIAIQEKLRQIRSTETAAQIIEDGLCRHAEDRQAQPFDNTVLPLSNTSKVHRKLRQSA